MVNYNFLLLILFFVSFGTSTSSSVGLLAPYDLQVENRPSTVQTPGYTDISNPYLSWKLASLGIPSQQIIQTAYRIVAAPTSRMLYEGNYLNWDSGWINSNNTIEIMYEGNGLENPGDSIWWSVFVKDTNAIISNLAVPVSLVKSPTLSATSGTPSADWQNAIFITANNTMQSSDCECYDETANTLPIFRTVFTPQNKSIYEIHLYSIGLGFYEIYFQGNRVGSNTVANLNTYGQTGFGIPYGGPGAAVGDDVLLPPWSNFSSTTYYSAYNLTSYISTSSLSSYVLGFVLGRGWYDPYPMRLFGNFNLRNVLPVGRPQVMALLVIKYTDNTYDYVVTNSNTASTTHQLSSVIPSSPTNKLTVQPWVWTTGPIRRNNIYIGEIYDARLNTPLINWTLPSYNANTWLPVLPSNRTNINGLRLLSLYPVRITRSFAPLSLTEPVPGVYVLAFPTNMAGWLSITGIQNAPAGTALNFTFAEVLEVNNTGLPDPTTNLAGAIGRWNGSTWGECAPVPAVEVDTWILQGGSAIESYTPKFTWHAFRYVRIDNWPTSAIGPPKISMFTALQTHVDNPVVGNFSSWNPQYAAIDNLVMESFRSNWAGGHQSDCPGRERLGYGGDLLAAAESAILQFDSHLLYRKRIQDHTDAQTTEGGFPETAPYIGIETCNTFPNDHTGPMQWGSAQTELQIELIPYYGNGRMVAEQYNASKLWLEHLNSSATADGVLTNGLCDFTFNGAGECACTGPKSVAPIMGTVFFAKQASNFARLARILGYMDDFTVWNARAEQIRTTFVTNYINHTTGVVGLPIGPQGEIHGFTAADAQAWALGLEIFYINNTQYNYSAIMMNVINELQTRLLNNGSHIYLGAFSTGYFYRYGHEWYTNYGNYRGLVDIGYTSLNQITYPGYGFMLANDAVSLWEHWANLWERDSFNHAWLGSVSVFFRRVIGGIGPSYNSYGFNSIRIRPVPPLLGSTNTLPQNPGQLPLNSSETGNMVWANTTYDSIRGLVSTAWTLTYGDTTSTAIMNLTIQVPPNVITTVELPLTAPVQNMESTLTPQPTACTWANDPEYDNFIGVIRYTLIGYTSCDFSVVYS